METEEVEHIEQIETEEQHETEYNVIPVQLVESYDGVTLGSHSNTKNVTLVKGKYYKQTYRPAWEQMPDFKGAKNTWTEKLSIFIYRMSQLIKIVLFIESREQIMSNK